MPKSLVPNQFDYAGIYVEGKRSQFRFHKPHLSSFMSGMLVPAGDPIPVFPGVKLDLLMDAVIRSNTLAVPPLDGIYFDVFAAWVPHRIVWTSMPQFLGENDTTAWTQSTTKVYPTVKLQTINNNICSSVINNSNLVGDVVAANHFLSVHYGLISGTTISSGISGYDLDINILAMRGYYAFWNHFMRDENYQRPVLLSKTDTGSAGEFGYLIRDYKANNNYTASTVFNLNVNVGAGVSMALLMPVNKFHDFATSVLPQAQYGPSVSLPLGTTAPVIDAGYATYGAASDTVLSFGGGLTGIGQTATDAGQHQLITDLSNATAASINSLRSAVMYQRYLEALARGGRRVTEYYDNIYGVKNSAAAKDYPEMLSHNRYILGVQQVVATADGSGSGWTSRLGDTGAYSLTNLRNIPICQKEFTEFGYLHIMFCVRADNRYSLAIPQHFTRRELLDEYNPFFDHVGDFDVPNYLVNMMASSRTNFGFQEAWWFERTEQALAVGALNKSYGSLAFWQLGEKLDSSVVTCTPGYLCFDPGVFNDVFVTPYFTYPQFIFDGLIHGVKAGRMSAHSIPGIVGRI